MANNKNPDRILVNGSVVMIKDPSAASGPLHDWLRFPGLSGVTMPSEAASVTETPLLDGIVTVPARTPVGTINAPVGGLSADITHQFLEERKVSQEPILFRVVQPAVAIFNAEVAANTSLVKAAAFDRVDPDGVTGLKKKKNILRSHYIAITKDVGAADINGDTAVLKYDADADVVGWRIIWAADDESGIFRVAPNFGNAVVSVAAAKTGKVLIRRAGLEWTDIECTVTQFDGGDMQADNIVTSNLTLTPTNIVPPRGINIKTEDELNITN